MTAAELNLEQLWTAQQVQDFLQCKRSWLYARVRAGDIPHIRLGGQMVRFVPDDVKTFAARLRELPAGLNVYLIQMMPDLAPRRMKVGYSSDVAARLKDYQTACPTAQVIAVRPGGSAIEREVLHRFAQAYPRLGAEVFDVGDIDGAVALFREVTS